MIFSKKGLTLLEILVAVTLFSIMMIFITQMVRMSFRYKKKISRDVKSQREISNTLEVVTQDINGMTTFFDFNKNLEYFYSLKEKKNVSDGNKENPDLFISNPEFDFFGKEQEFKFVTFSLVESTNGEKAYQLIRVHYFLQECRDLKTDKKTQCLLRSIVRFRDDREIINTYVILRGIQSFNFFYYNREEKEWLKEWDVSSYENFQGNASFSKWLPEFIKMDVEWKGKKLYKESHIFPLSYPLLRNQKHQLQRILSFVKNKKKGTVNTKNEPNRGNKDEKDLKSFDRQPPIGIPRASTRVHPFISPPTKRNSDERN